MKKKLLGLITLPLVALPMVACQGSHSTDAAKAKTPAAAEDAQLKADGYKPFDVPLFGKADVGIKGNSYEAAVYTGKLTAAVVDSASKKQQPGITIKAHGNVTTVTANSLKQLKNGVKTVIHSL